MGCIYLAESFTTGKAYIGKTIRSMESRKAQHLNTARKGHGYRFHRAIRKYGEDDFKWTVLAESKSNIELFAMEERFIEQYESTNKKYGYNVSPGGSQWDGTVPWPDAMRMLCRDYGQICDLNEWATGKLARHPSGTPISVRGNKLAKIAIPMLFKVLPIALKTTEVLKERLGHAFDLLDDRYARYEIKGYWKTVRKVGA